MSLEPQVESVGTGAGAESWR